MGTREATGTPRTERADYQATADPALMKEADRTSEVKLLSYAELYGLWERQQWQTQELDFGRDREDWHERISAEERFQRMYGLSSFFIGEQKVAEELGPIEADAEAFRSEVEAATSSKVVLLKPGEAHSP